MFPTQEYTSAEKLHQNHQMNPLYIQTWMAHTQKEKTEICMIPYASLCVKKLSIFKKS